jgi:hypothetical protein
MIDKNKILIIKNDTQVIICFNGCKLIKPIAGFEDMSKDAIRDIFWKEIGGEIVE